MPDLARSVISAGNRNKMTGPQSSGLYRERKDGIRGEERRVGETGFMLTDFRILGA
jgi:hypothetical protein